MRAQPQPARPDLPKGMPFTVSEADGVLRIVLAEDAGLHPGLDLPYSHRWIRGVERRVVVDFARIRILDRSLQAWLFRIISDGRLPSLIVANASRLVLQQLRQMGLSKLIAPMSGA